MISFQVTHIVWGNLWHEVILPLAKVRGYVTECSWFLPNFISYLERDEIIEPEKVLVMRRKPFSLDPQKGCTSRV